MKTEEQQPPSVKKGSNQPLLAASRWHIAAEVHDEAGNLLGYQFQPETYRTAFYRTLLTFLETPDDDDNGRALLDIG